SDTAMLASPALSGGSWAEPPLKAKSSAISGTDGSYTIQASMPPGLTMRSTLVALAESGNAVTAPARASAPITARDTLFVTRGPDPRVHPLRERVDCRVISAFTRVCRRAMPGNDEV